MTQLEFYQLSEVKNQLNIQRSNPYGSESHKKAFDAIGEIAKSCGVFERYTEAKGGLY